MITFRGDAAEGVRMETTGSGDWVHVAIRPLADPDRGYWVLARRSLTDPTDLAYYVGYGPAAVEAPPLLEHREIVTNLGERHLTWPFGLPPVPKAAGGQTGKVLGIDVIFGDDAAHLWQA